MRNDNESTSGFYIETAGRLDEARTRLRPMSDLADLEATLAEIESHSTATKSAAPDLVVTLDERQVFAAYNRRKALGAE